jgi:predicted ATPase
VDAVQQELRAHGCSTELPLGFLGEADVARYLEIRFAPGASRDDLDGLARAVHRRTEGNPLFMVNLVDELLGGTTLEADAARTLRDAAARARRSVPPSLRQMIEQRVERLDPGDQLLLEAASAAGLEFTAAAVAAALESPVEEVERRCARLARTARLLDVSGAEEWADGTVSARFRFVHALYQSVLHERLTPTRLVSLHRRIGERLERGHGARSAEIAAELAVHFESGREIARALRWLETAADNALRKNASAEAARLLGRAIDLLASLPATRERAQHELALQVRLGAPLAMTRGYGAPEVVAAYRRALELCREIGEGPELLLARVGVYRFSLVRSELRTAKQLGEQVLGQAEEAALPIGSLAGHLMIGVSTLGLGELSTAREHLEKGLALYDPEQQRAVAIAFGDDPGVSCLAELAMALWFLGYPDQALKRARQGLESAARTDIPYSTAFALTYLVWSRLLRRELHSCREQIDAAVKIATEHGFRHWVAQATAVRGWVLADAGEIEAGIEQIREGVATYSAIGAEVIRPWHLARMAEAYGQLGKMADARAVLDEAVASMGRREERLYEAELHRLRGDLALGSLGRRPTADRGAVSDRDLAEAEDCFQRAIELARRQGAKSLELRAVSSLARLWERRNKRVAARRRLGEIYRWFDEGFETGDLREARALLARLA